MSTSEPGPTTPAGHDPYRRDDPQGGSTPGPYGQDPYGPPPQGQDPYAPAAPAPRNGLGVAALVVGIVALLLGIIPFLGVLGVVGVVAVVLGVVSLSRVRRGLATNRGVSITGVVLGGLAVLAAIGWLVVIIIGVTSETGQQVIACAELPASQQQQCTQDVAEGLLGTQQP